VLVVPFACHLQPQVSGPDGLVGVVLDGGGRPVAGVRVSSLEAEALTGADGRFAVWFKEPEQFVRFDWEGLSWQRRRLAEDDGRIVSLALPEPVAISLDCASVRRDVLLSWSVGEGLTASQPVQCADGGTRRLRAPPGVPTAAPGTLVVRTDVGLALAEGPP
jgi:hypothetical protein